MGTDNTTATPRASANLTISFGMVNIEVGLGNLVEPDPGIKGKTICTVHQEGVKRHWWCEKGEHDCTAESESVFMVDGKIVKIDTKELESVRDKVIHLDACVPVEKIDPLYFETAYLVWPVGSSAEGYDLLADALKQTGKVALGTCVMSKKSRMFVIRWSEVAGMLFAHSCAYDEYVRWYNVKLVADAMKQRPKSDKKNLAMAVQLINGLDSEFTPEKYRDDYQERLGKALAAAAKGKKAPARPKENIPAATPDLMAALQASLEETKKAKATSNGAKKKVAA